MEFLAQGQARPVQPGLHDIVADAQYFGGIFSGELFQIAKQNHGAQRFRQLRNSEPHDAGGLVIEELAVGKNLPVTNLERLIE